MDETSIILKKISIRVIILFYYYFKKTNSYKFTFKVFFKYKLIFIDSFTINFTKMNLTFSLFPFIINDPHSLAAEYIYFLSIPFLFF